MTVIVYLVFAVVVEIIILVNDCHLITFCPAKSHLDRRCWTGPRHCKVTNELL